MRRLFCTLQSLWIVGGLVVFEDFMYWPTIYPSRLHKCTKFSCANKTALNTPGKNVENMLLYHPIAQPQCKCHEQSWRFLDKHSRYCYESLYSAYGIIQANKVWI